MRIMIIHNTNPRTFGDSIRVNEIKLKLRTSGFEVVELRLPLIVRFDLLSPRNSKNIFMAFFYLNRTIRSRQYFSISNLSNALIDSISFGFLHKQILRIKPNVILAETSAVGFIASIIAKEHGITCITDMHGLTFAEAIGLKRKNWQETFYRDVRALQRSDRVIVVSKKMKDYINSKWAIPISKIIVIPNGTNPQQHIASYSFPLHVIYAGGFAYWEKIDDFIEIARHADKNKFKFFLAGDGPLRDKILETIKKENIPITYLGHIPNKKIFSILSRMQIGVAPSTRDLARQVASPVKIYDYLAAGLPVITPNIGDWGNLIINKNCGVALDDDSIQEYLNALDLMTIREFWNKKASNAIEAVTSECSWDKALRPLVDCLLKNY